MLYTTLLLSILPFSTFTLAAVNGRCTGTSLHQVEGICISTANCAAAGGVSIVGACPNDPANIRCCHVEPCEDSSSYCTWTSRGCAGGTFLTGKLRERG